VRRVEAVAGEPAQALIRAEQAQLEALGGLLRPDGGSPADQVAALLDEQKALRRELAKHQQDSARAGLEGALAAPREVAGLRLVRARVEAEDRDALMQLGDHARDTLGTGGVVVLAAEPQGKAAVLVTLTDDLVKAKRLHAGNLVKAIAEKAGGRGGGRPNMAQAGLPDAAALNVALEAAAEIVADQAG
jgi:alanyl-tRNA synthetase